MNRLMVGVATLLAGGMLMTTAAWADTATADATIAIDIKPITQLSLIRAFGCCTSRGNPNIVIFDKIDFDERPNGDPGSMFAPYNGSENGLSWSLFAIRTTSANWDLTADVTGTAGSKNLKDILFLTVGDFFTFDGQNKGGGSGSSGGGSNFELLDTFARHYNIPFSGTASMKYKADIRDVQAGTFAGKVTYTLTTAF